MFFGRAGSGPLMQSAAGLLSLASIANGAGVMVRSTPEHRVLYQLDLTTGVVSLSSSLGTATGAITARPTQVFIYRPRGTKGPAVRIQLAADQPAQALAAGDYLSFSPPADEPVQVRLLPATGPATLLPIIPTTEAPLYLECRPAEAIPRRSGRYPARAVAVG